MHNLKGRDKLVVFVPTQILAGQTLQTFLEGNISAEYVKGENTGIKDACTQSRVLIFTYGSRIAEEVIENYLLDSDSIIAFDECHTSIWFDGYFEVFNAVRALNFKTIQLTATPLFGEEASVIKELRYTKKNPLYKPTIEQVYFIKQNPRPETKSLVKHIIKWWGMQNRGKRLIIYENNKQVISDCITMLQKELPDAKTLGFFTTDREEKYNDGINATGDEQQKK